jgi:hypothetical protein
MPGITDDGLRKKGVDGLMMTIYRFQTVKKLAEMLDF